MIISKMHWLFKERFNRGSTNFYPDFTPMQIDQFINDSVDMLIQKHSAREDKQLFFDMLNPLLVTDTIKFTEPNFFLLSDLKHPYFYNKRIIANTADCGAIKVIIEGHGRLNDILNDAFQKPSNKWRRVIGVFENNGVRVYSESPVQSLTISYYKYPNQVFFGGYDTLEYLDCNKTSSNCSQYYSKTSTPQDCEINPTYHARVVDVAVQEAQRTLGQENISLTVNKVDSIIN